MSYKLRTTLHQALKKSLDLVQRIVPIPHCLLCSAVKLQDMKSHTEHSDKHFYSTRVVMLPSLFLENSDTSHFHHHFMLDPVLSLLTELAGFRMVIVFTTPRHFVRSHASSFTSPFFFISFSTCFFHVCLGLPLLPLTSNFKAFTIHLLSSEHDGTTAYYLL